MLYTVQWGGEDASGWKLEISSSSLFSPGSSNSAVVWRGDREELEPP